MARKRLSQIAPEGWWLAVSGRSGARGGTKRTYPTYLPKSVTFTGYQYHYLLAALRRAGKARQTGLSMKPREFGESGDEKSPSRPSLPLATRSITNTVVVGCGHRSYVETCDLNLNLRSSFEIN